MSCDYTRTCSYEKGQISSVNFPGKYLKRSTCVWTLTSDLGSYISLEFLSFDVPSLGVCDSSSVTVSSNKDFDGGVFCNLRRPPMTILSDFNILHIKFQTGAEDPGNGFLAEYEQMQRAFEIDVSQGNRIIIMGNKIAMVGRGKGLQSRENGFVFLNIMC